MLFVFVNPRDVERVLLGMRRFVLAVLVVFGLVGMAAPASAQDCDCADFGSQAEAQAYFEAGGGSPSYNYNNLDANNNGVACEDYDYSGGGGTSTGGNTTAGGTDTDNGGTTGELPAVGSGPMTGESTSLAVAVTGISAVLMAGAVEVALSAGLTTMGVASAPAVGAVMIYRLLTFWLPVLPGFLAFHQLQKQELI